MSLLHKLWDETLAGPTPDSGLGKLRKYDSFSAFSSSSGDVNGGAGGLPVTRHITIIRTSSDPSSFSDNDSSPSTPGTPVGDFKKFTRRKSSAQAQRADTTTRG